MVGHISLCSPTENYPYSTHCTSLGRQNSFLILDPIVQNLPNLILWETFCNRLDPLDPLPFSRAFILDAVRVLREQGGVWVYLLQEERARAAGARPDLEYDSAGGSGSSGIASGNSSSIPWGDEKESHSSSSSAGSATNHNNNLKQQQQMKRLLQHQVELTPEHQAYGARTPSGRTRRRGDGGAGGGGGRPGEEDLIQRASDVPGPVPGPVPVPASSSSTSSLFILVRDRLAAEGIRLAAPPFTSKVGKEYRRKEERRGKIKEVRREVDV